MKSVLVLAAGCAGLLCAAQTWAVDPITLHYEERAPYLYGVEPGEVHGSTADPAAQAFRTAGIPFVWEQSSMNRQTHLLKDNAGQMCVVGWFWTPERAAYMKYTKPFYRERPIVGLARKGFPIPPDSTLERTLALPGLRVLVKANYSYGGDVDNLRKKLHPQTTASPLTNTHLVDQLTGNHADLMFVTEDEARLLLEQSEASMRDLRLVHFPDLARGEGRHIVCTRNVPDEVITRLNQAIGP